MNWILPTALLGAGASVAYGSHRHRRAVQHRQEVDLLRHTAVAEALAPPIPFSATGGVVVVIAALNEDDSIRQVLSDIPTSVCGLPVGVVVVDDGSTDQTATLAAECGAVVVRHPRNLGQADGLRTGFACAQKLGADIVVTMDADGQHAPEELPLLVQPVLDGSADYVQGSRFLGEYDDRRSARHLGIVGFTSLINALTDAGITDCTNGYRAIRASGLQRMRLVEGRFNASEIIIEAKGRGLRILEVPVHIRHREFGTSKKPRGLGYPVGYLNSIGRSWVRSKRPARTR